MPDNLRKNAPEETRKALRKLILDNEEWLMERILYYATLHDYTRYTSTLKEAWRASIEGLSTSMLATLESRPDIPEFGPDEDWLNDPCGEFGRKEAEKHRNRGITLAMFLALMKYYRQCYLDLLQQADDFPAGEKWAELFIQRVFDRVEISFGQHWSGVDVDSLTNNLQQQNRFLANEKNKFLTLFESYSMPCFLVTNSGYLDCMNLSATRVFGYGLSAGEHYYRADSDEQVPDWLLTELSDFSAGAVDEEVFEKKYRGDRGERTFVVHFKRMLDVSGKYSGIVVSLADVTMRILDKQKLEKAHAELQAAQEQMVQREKMASIGRLATGMAHEINNPLAIILQNLQVVEQRLKTDFKRNQKIAEECGLDLPVLQKYLEKQQLSKMLHSIRESGCRAASIVNKVSSFSRSSQDAVLQIDVCKLLKKAVSLMQSADNPCQRNAFSRVQVCCQFAEPLPEILANELELQQAIIGILENAVQALSAIENQPRLDLQVSCEEGYVVIEIADNGPGMTEDECQKVFDPFYTTRAPGEGLGLGLTIVYKIIQRYDGQIRVESSPGAGCKVVIKLPAVKDTPGSDVRYAAGTCSE